MSARESQPRILLKDAGLFAEKTVLSSANLENLPRRVIAVTFLKSADLFSLSKFDTFGCALCINYKQLKLTKITNCVD